jgi:hypothetical protein
MLVGRNNENDRDSHKSLHGIETSLALKGECAFEQGYAELLYSSKNGRAVIYVISGLSHIKN